MQHGEAREFSAGLFSDKDLMTYRNGKRALSRLVIQSASLATITYGCNDDQEAKGVVDDVLLSPLWKA